MWRPDLLPRLASERLTRRTTSRLDRYASAVFGCAPALARTGGVHLTPCPARGLPSWKGFTLPVVALAFDEGAVVAVRPDLMDGLRDAMGSDVRAPRLDHAALTRLQYRFRGLLPHAFTLAGAVRAVDAACFRPSARPERAERIAWDDSAALHLRTRFDGEVFGVRGPRGNLVSWAALKLKDDAVWEIAVATDADYRGRGYARDVVSAATAFGLEQGRTPLYIHDHDNGASAFVCRSLGYQRYADIALAEY